MTNGLKEYFHLPKELYALVVSKMINSIGNFILPLLTLILTQKVGLNEADTGFYLLMLNVSFVPGLLLGGILADKFGRKRVIIIFHSLAAIVYFSCGFIRPSMLMVFLLILGSSLLSASLPAYDALAADLTNTDNRKRAFSLLVMGHNLGFAIAPVMAGFLFRRFLPLVFIIDASTTFISVFLIGVLVREPKKDHKMNDKPKEIRKGTKNVFMFLKNKPIIIYFSMLLFCYNFAYSQWGFTLPLQLVKLFSDKGPHIYGLLAGFNGVLILLLTPVITKVTLKTIPLKVIAAGGLFYAAAFAILSFISDLPFFYLVVIIMTLGEMMITVNNSTFIASVTPPEFRGVINATVQIIFGAGFALGPLIIGEVLKYLTIKQIWLIISGEVLFAAMLMYLLYRFLKSSSINNRY